MTRTTEEIKWQRNMWKSFFFRLAPSALTGTNNTNASNCRNFISAAVWLGFCELRRTKRPKKSLRPREASDIKIQATNDQMHSNRYLLISGFITSRMSRKEKNDYRQPSASRYLIISLWTCSRSRAPAWTAFFRSRCEFDNYFFLFRVYFERSIAITWNSIP